ncbi:MAG: hypothetical protein QW292_09235 [Candidatus Parvarchaeota archaeon]
MTAPERYEEVRRSGEAQCGSKDYIWPLRMEKDIGFSNRKRKGRKSKLSQEQKKRFRAIIASGALAPWISH